MKRFPCTLLALAAASAMLPLTARAQEPIVVAPNPETLFTDADPKLHANKQVVLHIVRDLIQCNRWDEASQWLTDRYLQHNPNVTSGRENVIKFFGPPPRTPNCDKLTMPIVNVLTDGDIVGVVFRVEYDDPRKPGSKYASISFDQWRILNGRADEHWDTAQLTPPR